MQETTKLRAGLYYFKGYKVVKVENGWKFWLTESDNSDMIRPTLKAAKASIEQFILENQRGN